MEATSFRPRRPWLAALLSLLYVPVGQIYAGRLRRGLCLWSVGGCLLPILAYCSVALPIGRSGFVLLVLCALAFPLYSATDAFALARRFRHAPPKPYQRWWAYVAFFLGFAWATSVVTVIDRTFIAKTFVVPTHAMAPTIMPGDRILVDKLWYHREHLSRGQLVVFRGNGPKSLMYVKRLAGLPGDEIEIKNERVFINGAEWDDPHAVLDGPPPPPFLYDKVVNHKPVKVPPDCFYVLGDNRRASMDSRFTGPIPLSNLYGIGRMIFWSQERTFPDPSDATRYNSGPIRWDRIGLRLD
ncbi:MAG: signal peptidase I [Thermoguttaceae bacterium]